MKKQLRAILFVCHLLLIGSGAACGQEATSHSMPPRVKQVLQWMPVDAETLIVANGPFEVPRSLGEKSPFLELVRALAYHPAIQLHNGLLQDHLQGHKVLLAVEASRRFTSPHGLGTMPFEGCAVLVFDRSADGALQAAMDAALASSSKTVQVSDAKATVFVEKWEEDEWSLFVVRPLPSVLLCATNQSFLEEVLARMKREDSVRAFPDELPEWRHVNFKASVWGLRHYRKEFSQTDPSSPLRAHAAANVPDADAVGVVFWYDALAARNAKVRYLTAAKDAVGIARQGWHHPNDNLTPTIEVVQPGVVEITATITDGDGSGPVFLFVLLGYLGHATYL